MDFLRRRTSNLSPSAYRSPIAMKMSSVAHVQPGAREKALLAKDPALDRFRSYKKSVSRVKRIGEVLTVIVVADARDYSYQLLLGQTLLDFDLFSASDTESNSFSETCDISRNYLASLRMTCHLECCYEIYVRATMREEARKKASQSA